MVEQGIENPCVGSSILSLATIPRTIFIPVFMLLRHELPEAWPWANGIIACFAGYMFHHEESVL